MIRGQTGSAWTMEGLGLESSLRIRNFYWAGDAFRPSLQLEPGPAGVLPLKLLRGQFALAEVADNRVTLVRDPLGINKLFFAVHHSGRVSIANYLIDLVRRGVPCEVIYSVPAGHRVEIDLHRRTFASSRYFTAQTGDARGDCSLDKEAAAIRGHLEAWFARLANQFHSRRILLCLSGGQDSGLIAALATRHFRDLTAYTYCFSQNGDEVSEDATSARRLARDLNIPVRLVTASRRDVLDAVHDALVYGQDWRDFNVHCAIVNELLGRAMADDLARAGDDTPALVLTGDLMNEFVADYSPVVYRGREYYSLPKVDQGALRRALIRGLNAGDREVGVFGRHGLDIIQPYGLLADVLLELPIRLVSHEDSKQNLARAIAGDLLPDWIFARTKVRAQIGTSRDITGILPVLLESGCDADWLRLTFRQAFGIDNDAFLSTFIHGGVYRSLSMFPTRVGTDGFLAH
ncbi:MAG: hypothetical protein DME04_01505 [Candidatus Rokuibacteriota bacterium]|nr:MAG: hypothetical protein DME04_01505 [Candidatus Rokubacteria bacterium]